MVSTTMRKIIFLLAMLATPALAGGTTVGGKTIDCFCTDTKGLRVELGDVICLRVNGRDFLAQCDMSQNVPTWRDIGEGCVTSKAGPSTLQSKPHLLEPSIQSRGVLAPVVGPKS